MPAGGVAHRYQFQCQQGQEEGVVAVARRAYQLHCRQADHHHDHRRKLVALGAEKHGSDQRSRRSADDPPAAAGQGDRSLGPHDTEHRGGHPRAVGDLEKAGDAGAEGGRHRQQQGKASGAYPRGPELGDAGVAASLARRSPGWVKGQLPEGRPRCPTEDQQPPPQRPQRAGPSTHGREKEAQGGHGNRRPQGGCGGLGDRLAGCPDDGEEDQKPQVPARQGPGHPGHSEQDDSDRRDPDADRAR